MRTIKIVYRHVGGSWSSYLQDYPDYSTQGETLENLIKHHNILSWKIKHFSVFVVLKRQRHDRARLVDEPNANRRGFPPGDESPEERSEDDRAAPNTPICHFIKIQR